MSQKYVIFINWKKKQGKIHLTTCHHARKHERLWKYDRLVDETGASWWGYYDSYQEARKKANKVCFKIWDCSQCNPHAHLNPISRFSFHRG